MERIDRTYRSATGWPSGAIAARTAEAISSSEGLESDEVTLALESRGIEGPSVVTRAMPNRLASVEEVGCARAHFRGVALTVFDPAWYLPLST
jgi:hypothetical protein